MQNLAEEGSGIPNNSNNHIDRTDDSDVFLVRPAQKLPELTTKHLEPAGVGTSLTTDFN